MTMMSSTDLRALNHLFVSEVRSGLISARIDAAWAKVAMAEARICQVEFDLQARLADAIMDCTKAIR